MPTETKREAHGLETKLTVTLTDVKHQMLLRWLSNNVHHDGDEGTATAILEQALEALSKRMEQPL